MTDIEPLIRDDLETLAPLPPSLRPDWDDVLARVEVRPGTAPVPQRRPKRFWLIVAVVVLACAVAAPALALLFGLIGRTDVPFVGHRAPFVIKRDFYNLSLIGPPLGGLGESGAKTIPGEAREVGSFTFVGRPYVLYVVPTTHGGFCWLFEGLAGGDCARTGTSTAVAGAGDVNPSALVYGTALKPVYPCPCTSGVQTEGRLVPSAFIGAILAPDAESLLIRYTNGATQRVPFVYVSKPINAGFFLADIPSGHETPTTQPDALLLLNANGKLIAERSVPSNFGQGIGGSLEGPAGTRPPFARVLIPSTPVKHATGDGVTVDIGSNGAVTFHLAGISARTRALIGPTADYGCFKFIPYYETTPYGPNFKEATASTVTIPGLVAKPPVDGCEIEGGYGHVWPDQNHSHAAVEIALTPRAQRFFQDRAAARDLALFLNSRTMQTIIKTNSHPAAAIAKRYGAAITRLPSPTRRLPAGRIGYTTTATTTTYIEYGTTGERFYVQTADGRVTHTNVDALAYVK
jgi:hypothetical protein